MPEYITVFFREPLIAGIQTVGWAEEVREYLAGHDVPRIDAIYSSGKLADGASAVILAGNEHASVIPPDLLGTLLYNPDTEGPIEIKQYIDLVIDSTTTLVLSLMHTMKHRHALVVASRTMAQGIARAVAERHGYSPDFEMNGYAVFGLGARRFELIANQTVST